MNCKSSRNSTPFQYSVATGDSPGVYYLRAHRLVRGTDTSRAACPARVRQESRPGLRPAWASVLKFTLKCILQAAAGLRICLVPLLMVLLALLLSTPARAATLPRAEAWQDLPTRVDQADFSFSPVIVVGSDGLPVVAYHRYETIPTGLYKVRLYVKRWDGTRWHPLGSWLNNRINRNAGSPVLALDQDNLPVIAWYESTDGYDSRFSVFLRRWDGVQWSPVSQVNESAFDSALIPHLAIGPDNQPLVAYAESSRLLGRHVPVKRFNGTVWEALGRMPGRGTPRAMAVDARGWITVAKTEEVGYEQHRFSVWRWNGRAWHALGDPLGMLTKNPVAGAELALTAGGQPWLSWIGRNPDNSQQLLQVRRWDPAQGGWQALPLEPAMGAAPAGQMNLLLWRDNQPLVGWLDGSGQQFTLELWNPWQQQWLRIGEGAPGEVNRGFDLSRATDDRLYLAWGRYEGLYQGGIHTACYPDCD